MKNKKIKYLLMGSISACILAASVVTPFAVSNISKADSGATFIASSVGLEVSMFNKNGGEITSSPSQVSTGEETFSCYSAMWSEISYFEVQYTGVISGTNLFNYQYSVTWTPAKIDEGQIDLIADRVLRRDLINTSTTNKEDISNKKIRFYVDNLNSETATVDSFAGNSVFSGTDYTKNGGWGVYQFGFVCNSSPSQSHLYEIKTTAANEIVVDPSLKSEITRSKYSIDNAYIVTIKESDYSYINRDQIRWKVEGVSAEGKDYVLMPSHRAEGDTTTRTILQDNSNDYNGTKFLFDFDISGNWKITCEILDTNGEVIKTSTNTIEVSTIKIMPTSTIIWIVVGCVAGAAIILTIIIVVSKKKEKVW